MPGYPTCESVHALPRTLHCGALRAAPHACLLNFTAVCPQELRSYYFNSAAGSADGRTNATHTVERYLSTCSYDKLLFNQDNQMIVEATIPCSGGLPCKCMRESTTAACHGGVRTHAGRAACGCSCAWEARSHRLRGPCTWAWLLCRHRWVAV